MVKGIRTKAIEYKVCVELELTLHFYLRLDVKNPKIRKSQIWHSRAKLDEKPVKF
jgi:hypothetical protein